MDLPDHIKLIREHMGDEIAKNVLMPSIIKGYLREHATEPSEDMDLNPHLSIKFYCSQIAEQVTKLGFTCSSEEVMLFWLTVAVYHGDLLPPFKT